MKRMHRATSLAAALVLLLSAVLPACASDAASAIEGGVKQGLQSVYRLLLAIALPIAVIAIVIAGFQFFMGGERGAEKAKKIGIYTVIGLVVVFVAPLLIEAVQGWFSDLSDGSSVWS